MSDDINPTRLWLRVLLVGLIDAHECMHDDNIFKDTDDLDWLASTDFEEICYYVGRHPDDVRKLAYDVDVIRSLKVAVSWRSKQDSEPDRRAYRLASDSIARQESLF